jgi:hypothetical protein
MIMYHFICIIRKEVVLINLFRKIEIALSVLMYISLFVDIVGAYYEKLILKLSNIIYRLLGVFFRAILSHSGYFLSCVNFFLYTLKSWFIGLPEFFYNINLHSCFSGSTQIALMVFDSLNNKIYKLYNKTFLIIDKYIHSQSIGYLYNKRITECEVVCDRIRNIY